MKVTDQLNRCVEITSTKRIISLVPSQTELLIDLGLEKQLVGITKFCIHPKRLRKNITQIGGTKKVDIEKVINLQPDIIIANKEENEKSDIEKLSKYFPVWISDIYTIEDAYYMIKSIGNFTSTSDKANEIVTKIKQSILQLSKPEEKKDVIYLIWNNPIMAAGSNNYINAMLKLEYYNNILNTEKEARYPGLTLERLKQLNPDKLLLSSEPFPFKEKHKAFFEKELPNTDVILVNGEVYSWYGSRMITSVKQLNNYTLTNVKKC